MSRGKKRAFQLAALLLPLLCLLLIEGILRLASVGYPTTFLLKTKINGQEVFVENQQFGWLFFPKAMARVPQPLVIPVEKPANTFRVAIFGESAAMGDPEPAFGFTRMMEVLLRERYPDRQFEFINTGMTAINSHTVLNIAQDCQKLKADLWVVYLGNNEVVGPYGAGTVFGAQTPPYWMIRASIWAKSTRMGQMMDSLRQRLTGKKGSGDSWGGMEMFLNQQVRHDDPRLERVYQHFQTNLREIVRLGRQSGAQVMVSSVAGSLKDCAPFAALHRPDLKPDALTQWNHHWETARTAETNGEWSAALGELERAGKLDDSYADLHFLRARLLEKLATTQTPAGRTNEIIREYESARDRDTLRFRPDSSTLQIISNVAQSFGPGVTYCPADTLLARAIGKPPGRDVLWEHVHFNFVGGYQMARLLGEQIDREYLASTQSSGKPPKPWLTMSNLFDRLPVTSWDQYQVTALMQKRMELAPFTHQMNHSESTGYIQDQLNRLRFATTPEGLRQAIARYQAAIATNSTDWMALEKFAELLEESGDLPESIQQWKRVREIVPQYVTAHYHIGNLLDKQGKSEDALAPFEEARRLKPDWDEVLNGIALCYINLNRPGEAVPLLKKALKLNPDFVAARVNMALALDRMGKAEEARAWHVETVRLHPDHVGARINLGKSFSQQADWTGALTNYECAVRLDPMNPIARYNLGNTLAALQRNDEAGSNYARAVEYSPEFAEAHVALGLALARRGDSAGALQHLGRAVELNPGDADSHFNYGVALANARRIAEAKTQFAEALRLNPENSQARQYLQRLQIAAPAIPRR